MLQLRLSLLLSSGILLSSCPCWCHCLLYSRVKEHNKGLQVCGERVDATVKAVFAALIWYTPELLPLLVSLFTIL